MPLKKPSKKQVFTVTTPSQSKVFQIDGNPITNIWEYYDTFPDNAIKLQFATNCLAVLVAICLLVQIRIFHKDLKGSQADQLQSFKYYKRSIISDIPGKIFAASFGILSSYALQPANITGNELIQTYVDTQNRFYPVISKLSKENIEQYTKGILSRVLGLLLSCPASNIKALNISASEVMTYTVQSVIDVSQVNKFLKDAVVTEDLVIAVLRSCALTTPGGLPKTHLEFDESEPSSVLEKQIFPNEIIRTGKTPITAQTVGNAPSVDEMKIHLTPDEFIRYKSARANNMNTIVKDYEIKVQNIISKATPAPAAPSSP